MRTLLRHQTSFQYRAYGGITDVQSDGRHTGVPRPSYGMPVEMRGVISPANGNAYTSAFGTFADYTHVIHMMDPTIEMTENGLILIGMDTFKVMRISKTLNVLRVAIKRVTSDGQNYN